MLDAACIKNANISLCSLCTGVLALFIRVRLSLYVRRVLPPQLYKRFFCIHRYTCRLYLTKFWDCDEKLMFYNLYSSAFERTQLTIRVMKNAIEIFSNSFGAVKNISHLNFQFDNVIHSTGFLPMDILEKYYFKEDDQTWQ